MKNEFEDVDELMIDKHRVEDDNSKDEIKIPHLTAGLISKSCADPPGSRAVNHGNSPTCLNISRQTVSKLWKQFQNDGTVVSRPGQGRKRMTTASEDRYLALTARRNRKATARQLSSELAAATGAVASRQTIYRRLNEKGLYARKPRVCVLLSSQKKRDRFF
ncbi:transposable element Tcb2 transposase [Trichonephila clavipes]|nr:transposable element Tcb2 transposase [Trichonephila clavipes]